MSMRQQWRHSGLLLLAATIWGTAFVAQSVGMDYIGPFTFNAARNLIGGIVLIPFVFILDRLFPEPMGEELSEKERADKRKILIWGGICCGVILTLASYFQQAGIQYTTVGRAGFVSACYIIIVPIFSLIFFRKRCGITVWIAVVLALAGLYLLCITDGLTIGKGDLLIMGSAVMFSLHILTIDHFSPMVDGVKLACLQFWVCGILSGIGMFLFEAPHLEAILEAWAPILYAGVLSTGVAYTLQIVGQKGINPTVAALIMSLESCISVISGWLILGQKLTSRELAGCGLMFVAIVLSQLPRKQIGPVKTGRD